MPKISELNTVAAPLGTDVIPLVEAGSTKKATLASLPISTATQAAIDANTAAIALKAPSASPTFTGTQTLPNAVITGGSITGITDLAIADGGTGASTAATARTNLGASTIGSTIFTAADAAAVRSAISGAQSGANTDITSLGTVTTTTQALNDSSTKIATTAFANPGVSMAANGYVKLPSGLIIQWGTASTSGGSTVIVTYPIAFPTGGWVAMATSRAGGAASIVANTDVGSTTQFTITGSAASTQTFAWLAIGR